MHINTVTDLRHQSRHMCWSWCITLRRWRFMDTNKFPNIFKKLKCWQIVSVILGDVSNLCGRLGSWSVDICGILGLRKCCFVCTLVCTTTQLSITRRPPHHASSTNTIECHFVSALVVRQTLTMHRLYNTRWFYFPLTLYNQKSKNHRWST